MNNLSKTGPNGNRLVNSRATPDPVMSNVYAGIADYPNVRIVGGHKLAQRLDEFMSVRFWVRHPQILPTNGVYKHGWK